MLLLPIKPINPTQVLPVTASAAEMVETLDIDCAMNLLAKQVGLIPCTVYREGV
jgi:hypothetical protein